MKNRVTRPSSKEVPLAVQSEFRTLMWYKSALEELNSIQSERAEELSAVIKSYLRYTPGNAGCKLEEEVNPPEIAPSLPDCVRYVPSSTPWYSRFLIPDSAADVLLSLKVWEGLLVLILSVLYLILVLWGKCHPN